MHHSSPSALILSIYFEKRWGWIQMLIFQNFDFFWKHLEKKMPETKDNEQIQLRNSNTTSD